MNSKTRGELLSELETCRSELEKLGANPALAAAREQLAGKAAMIEAALAHEPLEQPPVTDL